ARRARVRSRCVPTLAPADSAPTAEGFALAGSRPLGCLLIHGFTATPDEMRPLGEALAARGFPVRAVRLAGHGTEVADLAGTRWTDWFASVAEGADRLHRSVPLANLELARRSLGSRLIESHVLERSWHVVTLDYDRDEVARLAADFLTRIEAGATPLAGRAAR